MQVLTLFLESQWVFWGKKKGQKYVQLEPSVTNPEMDGLDIGGDSISNVPFSLSVSRQKTTAAKEEGRNIVQMKH